MKKQMFTQLIGASILLGVSASYAMEPGARQNEFVHAASDGRLDLVKQGLQQHGVDIDGHCDCKSTALIDAVLQNHDAVVQFLLARGAAINKADGQGRTALFASAGKGNLAILKFLLENGADIYAKNENGTTVLQIAVIQNVVSSLGTFFGIPCCSFSVSNSSDKVDVVKHLLVAGCGHTVKNNNGKTAHDRAEDEKTKEMLANPDAYMQKHSEEFEEARNWQLQVFGNKQNKAKGNILTILQNRERGSKSWQQQERICCYCGKNEQEAIQKKLLRCSQCSKTLYCSRLCQNKDWKEHKQHCEN